MVAFANYAINPVRRLINGVVVSHGLMNKTVKVRVGARKFDKHIKKHFNKPDHHLVHDPGNSLRTGDIVEISPGWPVSKRIRHVIVRIIKPFGTPIEERPPVPTEEQRIKEYMIKKTIKDARKRATKAEEFDEQKKPVLKMEDGTPIVLDGTGDVVSPKFGMKDGMLVVLGRSEGSVKMLLLPPPLPQAEDKQKPAQKEKSDVQNSGKKEESDVD